MHRKSEVELLPLDTNIKRTLKNLRKVTCTGDRSMDNQIEIVDYSRRRRSRETTEA